MSGFPYVVPDEIAYIDRQERMRAATHGKVLDRRVMESILRHRRDVRKGLRRPLPKRELRHRLFTIHRLTRAEFEAQWAAQEEIA